MKDMQFSTSGYFYQITSVEKNHKMDEDPLKEVLQRAKNRIEIELGMHSIHLSINFL